MPDAVTAFEARRLAIAAMRKTWRRPWKRMRFPLNHSFENATTYVFGYCTNRVDDPEYLHRGARVPFIRKADGTVYFEKCGPQLRQRYPDLLVVAPEWRLYEPMTWDTKVARRLHLGIDSEVTPFEAMTIVMAVVTKYWKPSWGELIFPEDGAVEYDDFYSFGYGARECIEGGDVKYLRLGSATPLIRKSDGGVHLIYQPPFLTEQFPGQRRPIPAELLRAP